MAAGKSIRLAFFPQNESYSWPAWEILKKTVDASPQAITGEVKVSVAEEGPLRASVCVERTLGDSRFRQWITLREGAQADRIDLVNDIDWQSSNALLKAEFPLSVSNPEAVYDLGVGSVARGNNTATAYEVYAQQWADLTDADGSYGVSVLNDSKYGWDKPADNTLRLTLLHTPATKGGYAYQNKQDFGHHTFTYSIVGHAGDYRAGGAVRKAEVLNQPLRAFVASRHGGALGRSFSLASSQNPNVALRALKQAEDSDEYVVRFYETSGLESQQAVVGFAAQIVDARELNGVEDVVGNAEFSGRELRFEVGPFGMKTFRVKLARPARALTPAAEAAVELPYNVKTASYNPFRSDANFDGKAAPTPPSCCRPASCTGVSASRWGIPPRRTASNAAATPSTCPAGAMASSTCWPPRPCTTRRPYSPSTERSTRHWYPIMAASSDSGAIRGIPSPTSRMRRWPSWARTSMI